MMAPQSQMSFPPHPNFSNSCKTMLFCKNYLNNIRTKIIKITEMLAKMSSLPDGWEAVTSHDGVYYWNTETGEVTWKKPKTPTKKFPPPPPPWPNSPPASEVSGYDPFNYAEDFTQDASLQPLPTCYENVVLLEETSPPEGETRRGIGGDNTAYQDIEQTSQQNNLADVTSEAVTSPSLERYQGPKEVEYTKVTRTPERKSAFRHSAVKRKFSNNVEELVITREELETNGVTAKPNLPQRSPSFSSEMEREMKEEDLDPVPPEDPEQQFTVPFEKQYEDVQDPVLLNKPLSLKPTLTYNIDEDPLLSSPEANISTHVGSRDSGLGLSSNSQVTSCPETFSLKIASTTRPGTLYENVELADNREESTANTNCVKTAELPEGWKKEIESDTGHIYYWHMESGTTQWEFPTGPPLSPEPAPPAPLAPVRPSSESTSGSSQPSTSSLLTSPLEPLGPERTNERNFSAVLLGLQDVDANEIKLGNCSKIIENCIHAISQRIEEGEEMVELEVVLQVFPGVLRELDANTSAVNKAHAINRIRAWGCSRENARYFAYIIRHSKTQTYKCNVYKCSTSAKSLTLALKDFANSSQAISDSSTHSSPKRHSKISSIESTPLASLQLQDEGEHSYQRFQVIYLGMIRVAEQKGMEIIWSSLEKLDNQPACWVEAAIDISSTHFRIIDSNSGDVLAETRVRFLSFLGLSKDDSMCGYITGDDGTFFCNGFKMEPNCIDLCVSMKKACEDRFERVRKTDSGTVTSSTSSQKKLSMESNFRARAESAGGKIGGFLKSKMSRVGKQVGTKLQRTSSAKTLYGSYQVQLFGTAQVPMENDKRAVEEAITYLEGQSSRLTNPFVVEFQITQGGFLFIDKEKRQFSKKFFSIGNVRYCLKKGHSVAFVVQNKAGFFDAYAMGEINTSASVIIETIQTAVNDNT